MKPLILSQWPLFLSVVAALKCSSDGECERLLRSGSSCDSGICTNPFARGCLKTIFGEEQSTKILENRVCNSDDHPNAQIDGICTGPHRLLPYIETRINPNNWQSSVFFGWIAQILLSEVLGVPTSIETGYKNVSLNFYDTKNTFTLPDGANNFDYLVESNKLAKDKKNCDSADKPCAHFMPEVWVRPESDKQISAVERDSNGIISGTGWYIPNYTLERYPFLASYVGLQDKTNSTAMREKLASIFKRPITWKEYCGKVSESKCITKDSVASRLPRKDEEGKYFVDGLYKGYFRATDKNDCTAGTCTGHIIDYPCGWFSYTDMQIHWNNIGLETDIDYTSGGQIDEVLKAANTSQEDIIVTWWYPTPNIKDFFRISLPKVTNECLAQRPSLKSKRCEETESERKGNEGSGCDYLLDMTDKYYSKSFLESNDDKPQAKRNPSSLFLKKLQISDIDIDDILNDWYSRHTDEGYDGREAVCLWVANNFEVGGDLWQYMPHGFPRKINENSSKPSLAIGTIVFGAVVSVFVLATKYATYRYRKVKVIVYSQPHFLYLFCVGYLLISIAAILYGIEASDGVCIAREWLVLLGYTLGNVPLLVKTAAINTLMQHAKKMKRVQISQKKLFGIVGGVSFISIVYLICWTALDPSIKDEELILLAEKTGEVNLQVTCKSKSAAWTIVAHVWETFYILCSSVLAVQSRKVIQKFNESKDVGNMAYVSFLFLVFRLLVNYLPSNVLDPSIQYGITSIILSLDAVANLSVYFGPKFYKIYKNDAEAVGKTRTRHISGLNKNTTSPGGKNSFICVECKQQKHISRASSMDPSQVSRNYSSGFQQSKIDSNLDVEKGDDTMTAQQKRNIPKRVSFHDKVVGSSDDFSTTKNNDEGTPLIDELPTANGDNKDEYSTTNSDDKVAYMADELLATNGDNNDELLTTSNDEDNGAADELPTTNGNNNK